MTFQCNLPLHLMRLIVSGDMFAITFGIGSTRLISERIRFAQVYSNYHNSIVKYSSWHLVLQQILSACFSLKRSVLHIRTWKCTQARKKVQANLATQLTSQPVPKKSVFPSSYDFGYITCLFMIFKRQKSLYIFSCLHGLPAICGLLT